MISMLIGCGLRRGEVLALRVDSIQLREEHWVIADLLGKAGHIRTVPIPAWVKVAADEWTEAGHITEGALFRSINKTGRVWGTGMTPKVLWEVVCAAATQARIDKLAPHERTLACGWINGAQSAVLQRPVLEAPGTAAVRGTESIVKSSRRAKDRARKR